MTSVVSGLFPYVLPSINDPKLGLTVYNTSNHAPTLEIGVIWWIPGMILALGYSIFVYKNFNGKVVVAEKSATAGH
jgi:cytochrome bd-type quinol oxidase subunit 2